MLIGHGFNDWLPKILENGGLTPEMAGFAASIPVLAGIASVLTVPRFTPLRLRGRIAALVSFLGAIVLYIISTSSGGLLITGLVFYGLLIRCTMPLLMLVLMDLPEIGPKYMGAAAGMYFCVSEIGGFTGPFLLGAIVDMTGEFIIGIIILSVMSAIMSILAISIRTQHALAEN